MKYFQQSASSPNGHKKVKSSIARRFKRAVIRIKKEQKEMREKLANIDSYILEFIQKEPEEAMDYSKICELMHKEAEDPMDYSKKRLEELKKDCELVHKEAEETMDYSKWLEESKKDCERIKNKAEKHGRCVDLFSRTFKQ